MTSGDSVTGLRERKKLATRRALLHEAVRLTVEHGLENVTVEDIAAAAGVSPRTFFNYFSSKEDAVVGDGPPRPTREALAVYASGGPTGDRVEDLKILVSSAIPVDPLPSLEDLKLRKCLLAREPSLAPKFMAVFSATEVGLVEAIATRTGTDTEDLHPQLVAALATTAMRFSIHRWLKAEETPNVDDVHSILAQTFETLRKGL